MLKNSLFLCLLFSVSVVAFAEDDRGRLPDGRAYRTDTQGMQLVDYVAELEVTVDELKRRVHGLQYEVEEQEDIIAALKRNGGEAPAVVEKDLLAQKTAREVLAVPLNSNCPSQKPCPVCPADPTEVALNCEAQITPLKVKLGKLSGENRSLRKALNQQERGVSEVEVQERMALEGALSRKDSETKELLASLGRMRSELEMTKKQQAKAQLELATLKERLEAEGEQTAIVNTQLREQNSSLAEQVEGLEDQLQQARLELDEQKASAKSAMREAQTVKASLATKKNTRAVVSSKGELRTLFNRTRGMVFERDRQYRLYKQASRKRVSVTMTPVRSKRGLTMTQISTRINFLKSMDESARLRRDLMDIQQLVKADKKVLSRVSSL